MIIRVEIQSDPHAIFELLQSSFDGDPHSDGSEPHIVDALRASNALTISLVAVNGQRIIGYVAFSPVEISDGTPACFGLGPVAVRPAEQCKGIGSALIEEGLRRLRDRNARVCVVLGDPDYYRRFGFEHDTALRYPGPPPEYFQRLLLSGSAPAGIVRYHAAFETNAA